MWGFVGFILIAVLFMIVYIRHKRKYKDMNKLPGPPVKLLIGNAMEFGSNLVDVFENTQRLIKTYGRLVRIWMGPLRLALFITDPDMVEFFLTKCDCTRKSAEYAIVKPFLGEGLVTSEGKTWQKFRRILTPAFHFKVLETFSHIFHKNMQTLIDKFKKENGKTFDVCNPIRHYAIDVLTETSMGTSFKCQENGDNGYLRATASYLEIFMKRFFSFFLKFDFIFKRTQDYAKTKKYLETMHGVTTEMIKKRKEERGNSSYDDSVGAFGIKNGKVFMDTLLDYPGLCDEEIRWHVDTILVTGHHTVSSAMSMALYELAKHCEVQQNILDEIHSVVGPDRKKVIQLTDLKDMRYLHRVVKELLRLYPPVPLFERETTADVVYKGMKIPAHTRISFHPYAQHRDPELFPDPEKFDPDRFLPENVLQRHPFAYIPFSAGPRHCIGMGYATIKIETMVANIVRHFKIHQSDFPHTPIIATDAVLKFTNGLPVKLVYRE